MEEKRDIELSLKLFVVLSRTLESVQKEVSKDIRRYELNPTEFAVLELLYHKNEQPIQKIGEKVLLASSSITYVIDKLEKKDYIYRRSCDQDRRVIYAVLTDKGKELMDEIFPQHKQSMRKIFAGLNIEEKEQIISLLKKLGHYAAEL